MSKSLVGKSALVTGASAGIGKATVDALVGAGVTVIATGRRGDALDALVRQHGATSVQTMAGDLNDAGFVAALAERAADVDIFVNNAGILKYAPLMEMDFADIEAMFQTNVLASFRVTLAVAAAMKARGRGHIVIMTSIAARQVYRLGVIYCTTKHALTAMAQGLRLEMQEYGIKVTEIAPGMVDTEIRETSDHPSVLQALESRKFLALTSEEIAEAVIYAAQCPDNCCPDLLELRPLGSS